MNKIQHIILFTFLFCINSVFAATLDEEIEAEASVQFSIDNIPANGTYKLHVYTFNGGATQNVDLSVNGGALLRSFFSHPTGLLREPLNSGDINGYQLSLGSPAIDAGKSFPEPLLTLKS